MNNLKARFALIPLNVNQSEKANNNELLIDPTTGHIYVMHEKKLISKTVELENRLNDMDKINELSRVHFTIPGKQIPDFFDLGAKGITHSIDGQGNIILSTIGNNKTIEIPMKTTKKLDFKDNVNCFYISEIFGKSKGSASVVDKMCRIDTNVVSSKDDRFNKMVAYSKPYPQIDPNSKAQFVLRLVFGPTNTMTIKAISVFKLPLSLLENNMDGEKLVFTSDSPNRTGSSDPGLWDDSLKNDVIININNNELDNGEYSMIVLLEDANGSIDVEYNLGTGINSFHADLSNYTNKGISKTIALSVYIDSHNQSLSRYIKIKRANLTSGKLYKVILTRQPVCQFADN